MEEAVVVVFWVEPEARRRDSGEGKTRDGRYEVRHARVDGKRGSGGKA